MPRKFPLFGSRGENLKSAIFFSEQRHPNERTKDFRRLRNRTKNGANFGTEFSTFNSDLVTFLQHLSTLITRIDDDDDDLFLAGTGVPLSKLSVIALT